MKKTLLSLMLPLCIFSANAQITVTDTDFGSIGTTIHMLNDTTVTGLSVGNASNSMSTWNFSSLGIDTRDTLDFLSLSGTPGASVFSGSNLTVFDGQNYTYLIKSSASVEIDGTYGDFLDLGVNLPVNVTPNTKIMEFPATLGNNFSGTSIIDSTVQNTFGLPIFDSIRVKRIIDYTRNINAYGDLTTPSGTYSTLRQYVEEVNTDSIWGYSTFTGWSLVSGTVETTHNYFWIANGEDYYVMQAAADGPDGNIVWASYQVGSNLISSVSTVDILCNGDGNGEATASAVGGISPFTYAWSNGGVSSTITGLGAGTYTVTITDATSATSVSSATITEPTVLTITEDNVNAEINGSDGAVEISITGGVSPYTYSWSSGQTTEDISGLTNGMYTVTVTDNNGCTAVNLSTVLDQVSINDLESDLELVVFPNPTSGIISFSENVEAVELFDLSGRKLMNQSNKLSSLDLSLFPEGIYILRIESAREIQLEKIRIIK